MTRRTDAEIGRIVRKAMKGMRIRRRRNFGPTMAEALTGTPARAMRGIKESDSDFLDNNNDVAVAILEALAPALPPAGG